MNSLWSRGREEGEDGVWGPSGVFPSWGSQALPPLHLLLIRSLPWTPLGYSEHHHHHCPLGVSFIWSPFYKWLVASHAEPMPDSLSMLASRDLCFQAAQRQNSGSTHHLRTQLLAALCSLRKAPGSDLGELGSGSRSDIRMGTSPRAWPRTGAKAASQLTSVSQQGWLPRGLPPPACWFLRYSECLFIPCHLMSLVIHSVMQTNHPSRPAV